MTRVPDPRFVVTHARRVVAMSAVLALWVGNVALCAGWQSTPEARMACCMSSATCPMHKSGGHDHFSKRTVDQAQADSCCAAASQRHDSVVAGAVFASFGPTALVPTAHFTLPTTSITAREWRALVPLLPSSVPKHLLLSVLLV